MTQLQAGYILDCVKETLELNFTASEVKGLLTQLSYFDIEINSTITSNNKPDFEQLLFVVHNIISRVLPTRSSLGLEEKFLNALKLTEQDEKMLEIGTIRHELKINETLIQKLFQGKLLLHKAILPSEFQQIKALFASFIKDNRVLTPSFIEN